MMDSNFTSPASTTSNQPASLRFKVLAALGGACAVVVAFTSIVLVQQFDAIERAAQLEAQNLARSVAYGAGMNRASLQDYVQGLDTLYKRDIFIVDRNRRTVADLNVDEIGETYAEDHGDEVSLTIEDGKLRTFVERSSQHPQGAMQIVVPLYARADHTVISGAVILEYTGIYQELLQATLWQLYLVGGVGLACALLIGIFGFRLSASIVRRLEDLQQGVTRMTDGQYETRVPMSDEDEIGRLTRSFNGMMDELQRSHFQLQLDIQNEKEASRQIEYLAYTDGLTGLPNRSHFSRSLDLALKRARRTQQSLALFFIDLDRFKNINDTLGHQAGDALLKDIAQRIKSCLDSRDVVARLGGDEFVVILPAMDETRLAALAHKILLAVAQPLNYLQHEFRITASIGISVHPADGADERMLMKNADIALYRAKEDGKNNFAFYAAEMDGHSIERLAFERDLERALEEKQFEVHYQPKVDAQSGLINGVEALLRWRHPDLGWVSPAHFIPVAEETGLILPLGRWVLETACRQQVAWRELGLQPLRMAVNLSARQFVDEALLRDLDAIIEQTGVDPHTLELEITESMLMRNVEKTSQTLLAFNQRGIALAVDDFGTGYSSLANLRRFPIDTLKIDRSFIRELPSNSEDKAIAHAIIAMGKSLSMTVVAEGVETLEQADFLREHACDELQGFYFSKAVCADDLTGMLETQAQVRQSPRLTSLP